MSKKLLSIMLLLVTQRVFASEIDICLARIPDATSGELSLSNPTARVAPYLYEVKVGDVIFSQSSSTSQCEKFGSNTKLLVVVRNHGKIEQSFYVDTSSYEKGACIWYKALYESWSVWGLNESGHICENRT